MCPDLENTSSHSELLVLPLMGHSAIVRTVCFNPMDDLMLLSGGLSKLNIVNCNIFILGDTDIKVWNSETGRNIANLKGH